MGTMVVILVTTVWECGTVHPFSRFNTFKKRQLTDTDVTRLVQYVEHGQLWLHNLADKSKYMIEGLFNIFSAKNTDNDYDLQSVQWFIIRSCAEFEYFNWGIIIILNIDKYFLGVKFNTIQACKKVIIIKLDDILYC